MRKPYYLFLIVALSSLAFLSGCKESGIHYSHAKHIERGLSDCNICHNYKEDLEPKWPKMAKCLSCHMKKFDTTNPASCLYCHTKPGMKIKVKHNVPKKYKEAIEATFEVIKKSKNDENLLNKVKNLKIGRLMLDYENTANIVKLAANDILFFGNPRGVEEIKKEIEEVTIENIKEAVNKYLKPELIFTTMLAPLNFKENNN